MPRQASRFSTEDYEPGWRPRATDAMNRAHLLDTARQPEHRRSSGEVSGARGASIPARASAGGVVRRFDDDRAIVPSGNATAGSPSGARVSVPAGAGKLLPATARWVSRLLVALVLLCLTLAGLFWWLLLHGAV